MIKGFNDNFSYYGGWDRPFDLTVGANGNAVRFPIVWNQHQPTPNAPVDFSSLDATRSQLFRTGLRAIPVILGSPYNVQHPGDGYGQTLDGQFTYPIGPQGRSAFGDFVVDVLKYFNPDAACNLIDVVEVWNEPNGPPDTSPYYMYPGFFVNLCKAAAGAVYNANDTGSFTSTKRVVSGGVYMNGDWEVYFDFIVEGAKALCTYELGLHPYYYYIQKPMSKAEYVEKAYTETMARYDAARSRMIAQGVSNELWVTEVATTSQSPWGNAGQNEAIQAIINRMKNRSSLGAFIVHRLFRDDFLDPPGSLLYLSSVCAGGPPNAPVKSAYGGIKAGFAGW